MSETCKVCDEPRSDEVLTCDKCGNMVCQSCATECSNCGKSHCRTCEDGAACDECGTEVCDECFNTLPNWRQCVECLDITCPDCHHCPKQASLEDTLVNYARLVGGFGALRAKLDEMQASGETP